MSTSNRINKPGYESYQPVLAARQFGLNQTSPHLLIHEKTLPRGILTEGFVASKVYNLFSEIKLQVPCDLEFSYSTDGFSWWEYWKPHLFRCNLTSALQAIDSAHPAPTEEVRFF